MNLESGLQIDLIGGIRRRAKLAALIAGVCVLGSYWVAMALKNQYTSSATIFVEPQAISEELIRSGAGETDLNRRLSLMSAQILSRPRLSRIIDELELYKKESKTMLREEVIDLMRSRLVIAPVLPEIGGETRKRKDEEAISTFEIIFTADKPDTAAAVAQRLANDFIREHIEERVNVTQKSLEFIDAEQNRIATRAREVEAQIRDLKTANAGKLPEDMATNQRLLERASQDLRDARRELDGAQSEVAFWENQSLAAAASMSPNDDASPIRKLQVLELQLSELKAKGYTPKHPDVIKTEQEIREVQAQIDASEEESDDEAPAMNAAQQNAEASKRRAQMQVKATQQEIERLQAQVQEISARLEETPKIASQLEQLERDQQHLAERFRDYAKRRQEASVQVDLERRQLGEQFRILEAAYPSPTPSFPNRPLIVVMGLLLGLAFGTAAAVMMEGVDTSYHGARDLQSSLGIPVLAAIPRILLESDRLAARRQLVRNAVAVATVTVFCLVGGAGTYVFVNGAPGFVRSVFQGEEPAPAATAPGPTAGTGPGTGS
jgi:polysaccharide chain length determinant protein (PEP-CTERM system associated)